MTEDKNIFLYTVCKEMTTRDTIVKEDTVLKSIKLECYIARTLPPYERIEN